MKQHVDDVRRYYERNTGLFERFGSRMSVGSVHRALWRPGVRTLDDALRVSHDLVADALPPLLQAGRVVDLGCGVGGALTDLRRRLPADVALVGLTLSRVQARRAARRVGSAAHIVESNFLASPFPAACFDFAYSIEAFAHAPSPDAYFSEAARLLRPRGRLALIDDVAARAPASTDEERIIDAFRRGWGVPSVLPFAKLIESAAQHGLLLCSDDDLTPWLRLRALPQRPTASILHHTRSWWSTNPSLAASAGSVALQSALALGLVCYRRMVFERAKW